MLHFYALVIILQIYNKNFNHQSFAPKISQTRLHYLLFTVPQTIKKILTKAMVRSYKRDPVGIQTQDLQNFFWPHSANKKLLTMAMARSYKRDPVGIQTQDLQNRNLTLYSAKLRSPLASAKLRILDERENWTMK